MTARTPRTERRGDALSKQRIVETAIAILDADGESGLTFRTLAARLATGSGAIYWHVADKDELLGAAADAIVAHIVTDECADAEPRETIRAVALGMFDAIDAHPWLGAQFSRVPWRPAMLRVFERIGTRLQALDVPEASLFDAWSALVNYILGVAGQNAANARLASRETDRTDVLAAVAEHWMHLSPGEFPFLRQAAVPLRDHDDREQFLAGIDLILAGIAILSDPRRRP